MKGEQAKRGAFEERRKIRRQVKLKSLKYKEKRQS
jgi:hypothetical protein